MAAEINRNPGAARAGSSPRLSTTCRRGTPSSWVCRRSPSSRPSRSTPSLPTMFLWAAATFGKRATGNRHSLWLGSSLIIVPADAGSGRARGGSWVIVTVSLARMFLVVLLLLTPVVRGGEAADQKASGPQEAPAPAPPPVIPLAEVASRATEVEALLRTFEALEAPSRKIAAIQSQLPAESARLELELQRTLSILRGHPTLEWLEGGQGALGAVAAHDEHVAPWAHAAGHATPGRPDPPGGGAADVDPGPGRRAGGEGARVDPRPDRRGPRRDRVGAEGPSGPARHRARPPGPRRPGGVPLRDGAGADRPGAEAGAGRAPRAGPPAALERRVVGCVARGRPPRPRQRHWLVGGSHPVPTQSRRGRRADGGLFLRCGRAAVGGATLGTSGGGRRRGPVVRGRGVRSSLLRRAAHHGGRPHHRVWARSPRDAGPARGYAPDPGDPVDHALRGPAGGPRPVHAGGAVRLRYRPAYPGRRAGPRAGALGAGDARGHSGARVRAAPRGSPAPPCGGGGIGAAEVPPDGGPASFCSCSPSRWGPRSLGICAWGGCWPPACSAAPSWRCS